MVRPDRAPRPVSNTTRSQVTTSVAATLTRSLPLFRVSKSTISRRCDRSGAKSYSADTSSTPARTPGDIRGRKIPGRPKQRVCNTLARLWARRHGPASGVPNQNDVIGVGLVVTVSQNCCRRSIRRSGALPAMIAALTEPIELPATQLGRGTPLSCRAA